MIYDTFLYDDELEMLKLRLKMLGNVVDRFIAVRGVRTFRGWPKPPMPFDPIYCHPKLRIYELPLPAFRNPWQAEGYSRNSALTAMPNLRPEDHVLIGDVDEIPEPGNVGKSGIHCMEFRQYDLIWAKKTLWWGTAGVSGEKILNGHAPDVIRMNRGTFPEIYGGYHLSYFFMDPIRIREKIKSFSHAEYDRPEFTDPESILTRMQQGLDLFEREGEDLIPAPPLPEAWRASLADLGLA